MSKMSLLVKSVNKHIGFFDGAKLSPARELHFDVFFIISGKKKGSKMTSEKEEEEQE